MVRVRTFIFHMSIAYDKSFLLVPSSKSPVKFKVKYQGQTCPKNGHHWGISVSQTQLAIPQKTNVFGGILESACLSVCPHVVHLCTKY